MLKDRHKIKQIIRTLRWIAKQEVCPVIKFVRDAEHPQAFTLSQSMQTGGIPTLTLNTLFLYRDGGKNVN